MDRKIVYPGALPLELDLLQTNKFAQIGLSKLAEAVLGFLPVVNGFEVSPTAPASMSVSVNPGQIFSMVNIDSDAYSSIDADTDHQTLKQFIALDSTVLSCPAPGTVGHSINYLVQVTFQEHDVDPVLLPYFNSSNPAQPYAGPSNNGQSQNTVRECRAVVTVKAGTSSTTGTQVTPSPDTDNVGLQVVTVAHGQTTISSGDISSYSEKYALPASGFIWDMRSRLYSKDVSGSGDFTLGYGEATNPIIELTGALTGNVHILLPNVPTQWVILNSTTGAYTVYLTTTPAGTDCSVQSGSASIAICDGSGLIRITSQSGSGGTYVDKTVFTATAGQTSFTMTYTPGEVFQVSRNGVLVDYTATSGTAVVLDAAANLNDEVIVYRGTLTVAVSGVVQATETVAGKAEIATQAETDTGTDDERIVTPLKLKTNLDNRILQATESVQGTAEIATQAETNAGTDDARIVTPLKLKTWFTTALVQATETVFGWLKIATQVQTDAGASDLVAVTPLKLASSIWRSIGIGQNWTDVSGSRVLGTTYTNSTNRPIMVAASFDSSANGLIEATVGAVVVTYLGCGFYPYKQSLSFIVPPGATYKLRTASGTAPTVSTWTELR